MPAVVLGRVLQGDFGALVTAALAMVATGFTGPRERVRTFGVYAAVSVGGPVLGLLTGVSLPACPILGFNLIFALVALMASTYRRTTPRWTAPTPTPTPVPPSTGLPGSLGPAALTHPGPVVDRRGDQRVVGALAIGLVLLAAFLCWQSPTSSPLLSPYVLMDRSLLGNFLTMALTGVGILCKPESSLADGFGDGHVPDRGRVSKHGDSSCFVRNHRMAVRQRAQSGGTGPTERRGPRRTTRFAAVFCSSP
ncbi:hypothetical protein [Streptomyces sp. NPDC055400]